jgi:hypothetical protein
MCPQRTSFRSRAARGPGRHTRVLRPAAHESLLIRRCVERCIEHVDALYALALLHRGDCRNAEAAVVDAIATAAGDADLSTVGASQVWRCLASHFELSDDHEVFIGSPSATIRMAGLSATQREAMALITSGRRPNDVAILLGVPVEQVQEDFRSGTQALDRALQRMT